MIKMGDVHETTPPEQKWFLKGETETLPDVSYVFNTKEELEAVIGKEEFQKGPTTGEFAAFGDYTTCYSSAVNTKAMNWAVGKLYESLGLPQGATIQANGKLQKELQLPQYATITLFNIEISKRK